MVVFISYLIILKLILILVVVNYPKLYLGRALDYGPFAYGRCKAIFFPLRKERRSRQNCLLMIFSEFKEQVLFSNGVSTFRYLLYMKITPICCGYRTFSNTIILLLFLKPLTWVKQLFSRNYFKAKQKGLTWRRLYWQSLFMILKKQYLWYRMVLRY